MFPDTRPECFQEAAHLGNWPKELLIITPIIILDVQFNSFSGILTDTVEKLKNK